MATTFKFGNGNWAVKEDYALAYNDENGNFKPLPFDFTRASSATRVNKNGLIETVPSGKPRIDFTDNTSGHLLLEPSRSNKITYSIPDSNWSIENGASITEDYAISPDGTQNASRVQIPTGSLARIYKSFTVDSNEDSVSFYIKSNTGSNFNVAFYLRDSGFGTVRYQDTSLEVTTEWQRVKIENQDLSAASVQVMVLFYNTAGSGDTWDFSLWGVQAEGGSYATSYIPTSGATVTRVAETANGAGNSTVFNDSEGVLYAEMAALADDGTNRYISLSDGSTNNNIVIRIGSSNTVLSRLFRGGSPLGSAIIDSTTDTKIDMKVAIVYNDTSHSLFVNGNKVGTQSVDSSYTSGILTKVNFDAGNGTSDFYGTIKDLRVYDTTLSDSELQALTS
jgi:hypothetical protein